MSSTLVLVIASVVAVFLFVLGMLFFRKSVELNQSDRLLIVKQYFKTRTIALDKELRHYYTQRVNYLRWGTVRSINLVLQSGQQLAVNSMFDENSFRQLAQLLEKDFKDKEQGAPQI